MNNREKILEQGTKYANENWNVHENPNEHDNAHDDFIAGALWAVKNCSIPDVVGRSEQCAHETSKISDDGKYWVCADCNERQSD